MGKPQEALHLVHRGISSLTESHHVLAVLTFCSGSLSFPAIHTLKGRVMAGSDRVAGVKLVDTHKVLRAPGIFFFFNYCLFVPAVSLKTLTFSVVFAQNPLGCCQPSPRPGLSSPTISLQEQLITVKRGAVLTVPSDSLSFQD